MEILQMMSVVKKIWKEPQMLETLNEFWWQMKSLLIICDTEID